jgi:drug/metabolite transporter (DMT)-like permease
MARGAAHGYLPLLLFLAAVWGASYLFIKVAVEDLEPAPLMLIRTLGAGILLFAFVAARGQAREVLLAWRPSLVLGVINAALPFWLIAWGEKHIDSSVAGIAQASVPVFVVLISVLLGERFGGSRLAGIGIGLLGVGVLTGLNPHGGWWAVAGTLAVVASSLSYAGAGVYGQRSVKSVAGPVLAAGSMLAGGVVLLPFALFQLPDHAPSWEAAGSIAALTLFGTVAAQLVLFRMLRLFGSARMSLVTYLMPAFAVFYGATLLDEPVTVAAIGGLALILAGVALGSGAVRLPARDAAVTQAP